MRPWIVLVSLFAVGCGSASTEPTRTYRANLTASLPIVGPCVDVRCTYTAVVTNTGPDCASPVSVAMSLTEPPQFPLLGVGASFSGVLRPNQSVTLSGSDWPVNGRLLDPPAASGHAIACP